MTPTMMTTQFLNNSNELLVLCQERNLSPEQIFQEHFERYNGVNNVVQEVFSYIAPISSDSGYAVLQWELPSQWQISVKAEVDDLINEAGVENWDGEDALPLSRETVELAKEVVDRLPPDIDKPDVDATPHGEVDFSWIIDKNVMFIISVGSEKEIVFVGVFHGTHIKGNETWNGILPEFVDCCFERLRKAQNL